MLVVVAGGGSAASSAAAAIELPAADGVSGGDEWSWPVTGSRQVLRPFIAPVRRWSAGHRGIDVRAWDPVVLAPAAGQVRFVGWVVDRPVLSIDHGGGVVSSYEPVASLLLEGDAVEVGQIIGTLEPAHCETLCLHLGVRVDGEYRNPLDWLGGVPRAVLLPTRERRRQVGGPAARGCACA